MMQCALAKGRAGQLRKMASEQMITCIKYFGSHKHGECTVLSIMIPRDQDWPLQHGGLFYFKLVGAISAHVYNRNMNKFTELINESKYIHL